MTASSPEYRSVLISLKTTKLDPVLESWSASGWSLHTCSMAQLGEGYSIEAHALVVFRRDRIDAPNESPVWALGADSQE